MTTATTWDLIHAERASMVETFESLTPEQWDAPSWCGAWSVRQTAGHIVAGAEQTPMNFYKQMATARFRFAVFADRDATRLGALEPAELIARLRARTTTTNHPPAPVIAMLGEIVVHGEDIRRPLGLTASHAPEALIAVADNYKGSNLLIGSKRRIEGLALVATDVEWATGDGPEVSGPLASLVVAMTGRAGAIEDLAGDGVGTLQARC